VTADYGDKSVEILPFIDDMAEAYSWADLVVCRAGALTVAELAVMGRPAILVPLPHAIDDHQSANARALSDAGAGLLLPQSEMTEQSLAGHIAAFIRRPGDLAAMSAAAATVARPDATGDIADICGELADAA
jgi:UDP-N-acetylglucosamine--N-acetylmuramyl-(pentapeptide) pyrophosphoryl-undecaprenol N-acetylglucosamine transferase